MSRSLAQNALRLHALVFALCCLFLLVINLVFSPSVLWVLWVAGPWLIGLSVHAFVVRTWASDESVDAANDSRRARSERRREREEKRLGSAPTRFSDTPPSPASDGPTQLAHVAASDAAVTQAQASARKSALSVGERVADRFVIEGLLGAGGMGEVYLAHDVTLNERVALKTIATALVGDAAIDRFRREALAARRITHPNVVRIHDIGEHAGVSFISMQYVPGHSLGAHIAKHGALPLSEVQRIALDCCAGLQAAHDAGVTHRDLKPDNVLLDDKGHARVIDFGLAHVSDHTGLTATGAVMGTPGYMAPEQVMGKGADMRTDVYALGCILYQALTGVPPFQRDSAIAVGFAHCYDTPAPISAHRPDIDVHWQAIVTRALEKDPDQRFQRVSELRDAIAKLAA